MRTEPADWRPRDIENLEPAAWDALRAGTLSVTAGPGAGKSEFLAQRASYLLETGLCRPPRQILAISLSGTRQPTSGDVCRHGCRNTPNGSPR
jgi:UvrD/REP helicase N-terminal domain